MKLMPMAIAAMMMSTSLAQAGGIDRSLLPYSILFEKGRVMQLGFTNVTPTVSGIAGGVASTGDMAQSYTRYSVSYKADLTDKLSYAIILNQPYSADSLYTAVYTGLEAHWSSNQLTALLKYKPTDRISIYGGLKYLRSSAEINIPRALFQASAPALGDYTASTDTDGKFGYVVGAAYEIPDIALRVGLSFESQITHEFASTERFSVLNGGATVNDTTKIIMPKSVALDFQSGVAKDTLVFGSIRWSEWSKWHVRPNYYNAVINDEITGYDNDVVTYQLGIGRRLNENLSVFARVGYEKTEGDVASRLAPTDGHTSYGIGGSYTKDNMKVTGGIEYVDLGDAVDGSNVQFRNNKAVGIGLSVQFTF